MKKIHLSVLAAVMFAMSCSEKDDPAPETETPNDAWLVSGYTKMLNIDSILIDTTHMQFHYNSDGTLKGTTWYNPGNADSMWQYTRNTYADGRLVKIEAKDEDKEWVTHKEFEYENGLHTLTVYNERVDIGDTLIYNSAGKLVEFNDYDMLGNGRQWKLTWDGANISQMEFILHSPEMVKSLGIYYLTYGAHKNFRRTMFKSNYNWLSSTNSFELLSENNCIKIEKITDGKLVSRETNEFTLNDRQQLESLVVKQRTFENDMPVIRSIEKYVFEYLKP